MIEITRIFIIYLIMTAWYYVEHVIFTFENKMFTRT